MDNEHVVDLKQAYDDPTPFVTPSATPAIDYRRGECARIEAPPSCVICRRTLLLSYFNCCAVCGNIIEPGRNSNYHSNRQQQDCWYNPSPDAAGLPTFATPNTNTNTNTNAGAAAGTMQIAENRDGGDKGRHCSSRFCRYAHNRWLLAVFALCECMPAAGALMLLAGALGGHSWGLLRFGGLMAVQWWQVFVLPRQWHAGRSIVAGQLAACAFMVWFYVEGRREWRWWEPCLVSTVLLKIVFPW